jgi:Ca2+-binding EF-hand superfamily protein
LSLTFFFRFIEAIRNNALHRIVTSSLGTGMAEMDISELIDDIDDEDWDEQDDVVGDTWLVIFWELFAGSPFDVLATAFTALDQHRRGALDYNDVENGEPPVSLVAFPS